MYKYITDQQSEQRIWIEWKPYRAKFSTHAGKDKPRKESVQRVKELVALLQSDKPSDFCTPPCVGYFDDRDDSDESEHEYRFGLVFEMPANASGPVSLHQLIERDTKPSLTDRILLAHKIAKCMLYLHTVNWLHKAFRSDSILFFTTDGNTDLTAPYLSGYEYARPDKKGETTTSTDADWWWQLYIHPDYQNKSPKPDYQKTFDVYSLGLVLLEIIHWKHIEDIVGIDPKSRPESVQEVRERLLQSGGQVAELRGNHGDKVWCAVESCISGRAAFGISEDENEMDIETAATLQREFTGKVVEPLGSICI